ncbi:TMEM175 family protein [soil metagenome]
MTTTRLEAFSDGVIAIIITIMVLELKTPHDTSWDSVFHLVPVFISYLFSFVIIGIYWGNHHHLLHTVESVNSKILWANLHLLFWLSIIPFATAWVGETNFENIAVAFYSAIQVACSIAYYILLRGIIKAHPHSKGIEESLEKQSKKGKFSLIAYIIAVPLALYTSLGAGILYILVSALWLIPDRNIEKSVNEMQKP